MEDKNITNNLIIKQFNESNAVAYNKDFISQSSDYEFKMLDNAYQPTIKEYANLTMAINNNQCSDPSCYYEKNALRQLEEAPAASIEFIENLIGELSVTDDSNFDVNNDYRYMVANSIMNAKPGFSKSDGYALDLYLNQDGSQTVVFQGPMLPEPLDTTRLIIF